MTQNKTDKHGEKTWKHMDLNNKKKLLLKPSLLFAF